MPFGNLFDGSSGISVVDAKLEGLHYVHVAAAEAYQFTMDGVEIPGQDFGAAGVNQGTLDGRYAQGLFAAPSMVVYHSATQAITQAFPVNTVNAPQLANFMSQVCIASCIATGTPVRAHTAGVPQTLAALDAAGLGNAQPLATMYANYRTAFPHCADDAAVINDVRSKVTCTLGFEATNEAYAAFYHTNHHNGASVRFERGIKFSYVAGQAYLGLNPAPLPVAGVDIGPNFQNSQALVDVVMRTLIHDTDHRGRAILVYDAAVSLLIRIPLTDHNRFSYTNAPAGVSHISGAHAILNDAAQLVHTQYANGIPALAAIITQVDFAAGMTRFQYSPFARYLTGNQPVPLPANVTAGLADAGALSDVAQDPTFNTVLTFLGGSSFQAVAVRRHCTPAARARAIRYLNIKRAVQVQRANITANDPNIQTAMTTAIQAEINGLVI